MNKVLITCYNNPDLDGFGGAVAYAEFLDHQGQSADILIVDQPSLEVEFLMNKFNFSYPEEVLNPQDYDKVVLVDASQLFALHGILDKNKVVEIIDHRIVNDAAEFQNAQIQIDSIGAAATIIAEKFYDAGIQPSQKSAILLCGAIFSNTLNFKSSNTHDRDRKMSGWLLGQIDNGEELFREMFLYKSNLEGDKLKKRIIDDLAQPKDLGFSLGVGQLEIVGVKKLITERKEDILQFLEDVKQEVGLNQIFLSIIDLDEECNYFISTDEQIKVILSSIFDIDFQDNIAYRPGLIMRKQIIPLIREELTRNE
jgi:manganese-dependent inorganic pyrophosphatase